MVSGLGILLQQKFFGAEYLPLEQNLRNTYGKVKIWHDLRVKMVQGKQNGKFERIEFI